MPGWILAQASMQWRTLLRIHTLPPGHHHPHAEPASGQHSLGSGCRVQWRHTRPCPGHARRGACVAGGLPGVQRCWSQSHSWGCKDPVKCKAQPRRYPLHVLLPLASSLASLTPPSYPSTHTQVGCMSRNVVVEGDEETSAFYAFGAQIKIHTHGSNPKARFYGEQVRRRARTAYAQGITDSLYSLLPYPQPSSLPSLPASLAPGRASVAPCTQVKPQRLPSSHVLASSCTRLDIGPTGLPTSYVLPPPSHVYRTSCGAWPGCSAAHRPPLLCQPHLAHTSPM